MLPFRFPRSKTGAFALTLTLACATLTACGDDDGGMGPTTSTPSNVTIRVTHAMVFGTCEGSSGLDGSGDFICEMQIAGPDGIVNVTPAPPTNALIEGEQGEVVPLDLEFVLDGAASEISFLQIQFDVSERDGPDVYDTRMRGSRGYVVLRPDADGSWNGITDVISVYGGSPCRIDFVVSLEQ